MARRVETKMQGNAVIRVLYNSSLVTCTEKVLRTLNIPTWAWTLLPSASWLFRSEQIDSVKFKSTLHT